MYQNKVKKAFRCKHNKEIYQIGSMYESDSLARMSELVNLGFLIEEEVQVEATEEKEEVKEVAEIPFKHVGGGVYELADGSRVRGKKKAMEASKK